RTKSYSDRAGITVFRGAMGRVERWRGSIWQPCMLPAPCGCRCPNISPTPRLHLPLIEPDGRLSRIRHSDQEPCGRSRGLRGRARDPEQTQRLLRLLERVGGVLRPLKVEFPRHPPTEPTPNVDGPFAIGLRDRPQTKVLGPPPQQLVELPHHLVHGQPQPPPS